MKKILFTLCCVFSISFISCAAKPRVNKTNNIIEAPENTESEDSSLDSQEEYDGTEETESEENSESKDISESNEYPEPEAFEEPEIITLEPVELVEEKPSAEDTYDSEIIEKEEPPVIAEKIPEEKNETTEILQENNSDGSTTDQIEKLVKTDTASSDVPSAKNKSAENSTDVIDITDDDSNSEDNTTEETPVKIEVIKPSRSVTIKKFEYLDVTYPGSGWIFMGLTDNSKDIAYFGRKLGTKDTMFTLQGRNAGTKIAHFYKNDPLSGKYIDDYIEITVLSESGSNKTHVEAPEYKIPVQTTESPAKNTEPVDASDDITNVNETETKAVETKPVEAKAAETKSTPKKNEQKPAENKTSESKPSETKPAESKPAQAKNEEKQTAQVNSAAKTQTANENPSTLLQEAQVLYNEKEYSAALNKVNQFLELAAEKRDEGLYLKGQILEAKSEVRDIKGSMEAYSSLTKNYPASYLWDSANKRLIYLKRFYLEVR